MKKKNLLIIIFVCFVMGIVLGYFVGRHIKLKKVEQAQYVCEVRVMLGNTVMNTITYWIDPAFNESPKYYAVSQYKIDYPHSSTPGQGEVRCFAISRG